MRQVRSRLACSLRAPTRAAALAAAASAGAPFALGVAEGGAAEALPASDGYAYRKPTVAEATGKVRPALSCPARLSARLGADVLLRSHGRSDLSALYDLSPFLPALAARDAACLLRR